jgi:hypothetical protein
VSESRANEEQLLEGEAGRAEAIRKMSADHLRRYLATDGEDGYEEGVARH